MATAAAASTRPDSEFLVVDKVGKTYRKGMTDVPVLDCVDLRVARGGFVALMGPSGSGKTTLLNMIAGIDSPTSGEIVIGGEKLTDMSEAELAKWRARTIGFVFQLYNLVPVLTAFENVELPLLLFPLTRAQRREHVKDALAIVGLGDRMSYFPRQLSGGQEQRVGIARAIVTDPALIVADEPTGDLDATTAHEILDLLSRLHSEFRKTIVMVTHDPHAAARAARLLSLEKGRLRDATGAAPLRSGLESV